MLKVISFNSLLVLILFVASPVLALDKGLMREAAQHQRSKNVAIVVGVEQYDEASTGVSRLQYAADDAVKLATVFNQNRYVVKRLVDQQASKHQVLETIRNAAQLIDPQNSTLVFSFSGHGFAENGKNYLMTAGSTTSNMQASALRLDDVIAALRQSRAKRIIVFIDACRNIPGQKSISRGFKAQNGQGVQILLSTKFGSLSWESPKLRQGVFSHFLVKGLQGAADNGSGIVEFTNLAHYVESSVKDWTFQHLSKIQQPFHRSHGELYGRFVVAAKGQFNSNTNTQNQQRIHQQRAAAERQRLAQQKANAERQRLAQQQAVAERQRIAQQQTAVARQRQAHQQALAQAQQRLAQQRAAAGQQRLAQQRAATQYRNISAGTLLSIINGNQPYVLVDARKRHEYNSRHIPTARNIPVDINTMNQTPILRHALPQNKNTTVIFYCHDSSCWYSEAMSKSALKLGYKNVFRFTGGVRAWRSAGYDFTE